MEKFGYEYDFFRLKALRYCTTTKKKSHLPTIVTGDKSAVGI